MVISFRTVGKAHSHAAEPDNRDFQVTAQVCAFALCLLSIVHVHTVVGEKQTEDALDTIGSLGWADQFFIRKVISVCRVWEVFAPPLRVQSSASNSWLPFSIEISSL